MHFHSEIIEKFPVRKKGEQKDGFLKYATAKAQEMGYTAKVEDVKNNRNLVIGDPESAKVIFTAHYDTPAVMPFPNFITPKKPLLSIGYSLLIVIPLIALVFLINILAGALKLDPLLTYWVSLVVYFLFIVMMLAGPANKHTANDNTSGVITLLEIYDALTQEQRNQVCFVFFDNEEQGLIGSGQFRRKYKKAIRDKLLINFDCVSDGDHFLLGITKKANQKYRVSIARAFTSTEKKNVMLENLKKVYYPSDQAGFPVAIAVASLKYKKPVGYYMDRIQTKRDTVFEEENIVYLTQRTVQLIENI